jgi:hypothetical protein
MSHVTVVMSRFGRVRAVAVPRRFVRDNSDNYHHYHHHLTSRNMGNDGGSIPDRRDLVRNKPKAEQADKANQTRARWFFCALSKVRLTKPTALVHLAKTHGRVCLSAHCRSPSCHANLENYTIKMR